VFTIYIGMYNKGVGFGGGNLNFPYDSQAFGFHHQNFSCHGQSMSTKDYRSSSLLSVALFGEAKNNLKIYFVEEGELARGSIFVSHEKNT